MKGLYEGYMRGLYKGNIDLWIPYVLHNMAPIWTSDRDAGRLMDPGPMDPLSCMGRDIRLAYTRYAHNDPMDPDETYTHTQY